MLVHPPVASEALQSLLHSFLFVRCRARAPCSPKALEEVVLGIRSMFAFMPDDYGNLPTVTNFSAYLWQ